MKYFIDKLLFENWNNIPIRITDLNNPMNQQNTTLLRSTSINSSLNLLDNNDVSCNFIVSRSSNLIVLQMEGLHCSEMKANSNIIIQSIPSEFSSSILVNFIATGYVNSSGSQRLFLISILLDQITIRNIDGSTFEKDENICIYPTTMVYHIFD